MTTLFVQEFLANYSFPGYDVIATNMNPIVRCPSKNIEIFKDTVECDSEKVEIHLFTNSYINPSVQIHPYNTEQDIVEMIQIILTNENYQVPSQLVPVLPHLLSPHHQSVLFDGMDSIAAIVNGTIQEFQNCSLDKIQSVKLFEFFDHDE
jgi:hypothetical protein